MSIYELKFKTVQFINGTSYLSKKQVEDLKHRMCHKLKIEKTDEHFQAIEEAVTAYFKMQNTFGWC
jgi:hypothetical protein